MLIVANNGEVTWQTETYKRKEGAHKAAVSGLKTLLRAAGMPVPEVIKILHYTDHTENDLQNNGATA